MHPSTRTQQTFPWFAWFESLWRIEDIFSAFFPSYRCLTFNSYLSYPIAGRINSERRSTATMKFPCELPILPGVNLPLGEYIFQGNGLKRQFDWFLHPLGQRGGVKSKYLDCPRRAIVVFCPCGWSWWRRVRVGDH